MTAITLARAGHAQEPLLSARLDGAAQEIVFEIGPLHLPANAGHDAVTQPKGQGVGLPITGYLHGFTTEMVDADGQPIPASLLHHVNIIAPQRRELFSQIMQRVGAAGAETGPVLIPRFLGYPVTAGDSLLFTAMFHNPTAVPYHNARLRVRMRYSTDNAWHPRWAVQPFYLEVMPPAGGHSFDLSSSFGGWGFPSVPITRTG
jgi:hypothetical protein